MSEGRVPNISGALLLNQRKAMVELIGAATLERALARLPEEIRRAYGALTALSWLPIPWFNAIVCAVAAEVGRDPIEFQSNIVRLSAERTFTTLWRLLLRVTSDEALVSRTPLIYARAYDHGELVTRITSPGRSEVIVRGWVDMPDIQIVSVKLAVSTVLKIAGRKNINVTSERRPTGAIYIATWRP